MNPRRTSLWIHAISIKSHSCQKRSNGYNALHNAIHNCNQSQRCTIDIFLIGYSLITVSDSSLDHPHSPLPATHHFLSLTTPCHSPIDPSHHYLSLTTRSLSITTPYHPPLPKFAPLAPPGSLEDTLPRAGKETMPRALEDTLPRALEETMPRVVEDTLPLPVF